MNTSERADRLGVGLFMFGIVNEPPREAIEATWSLLSIEEVALFRELTPEDIALANACLEVEAERRARGWAALEQFDALMAGPDRELPEPEKRELADAILTLGWDRFPVEAE